MNNKVKMLAPGSVALLAGCAQMAARDCNDTVTVNYRAANLRASPELAEVCPGGTLTVRLRPPAAAGRAHTAPGPENPGANWLAGRTSKGDRIDLVLDENEVEVGETYKYSITIEGIGTLDPRVRVIRSAAK